MTGRVPFRELVDSIARVLRTKPVFLRPDVFKGTNLEACSVVLKFTPTRPTPYSLEVNRNNAVAFYSENFGTEREMVYHVIKLADAAVYVHQNGQLIDRATAEAAEKVADVEFLRRGLGFAPKST